MAAALILSLSSMLLFGVSNGLQKIPTGRIGAVKFITCRGVVISIITFIFAALKFDPKLFDLQTVSLAILLSAVSYLGLYFFSMGLFESKAGIVIPISSSRVVVITIMGIVFLGDIVNIGKLLCIVPIIVGIVLVSLDLKALHGSDLKKGIGYALLAALFWGITFPFFGTFSNKLGVYTFAFILEFTVFVVSMLQSILINKNNQVLPSKNELLVSWKLILLVSVTGAFGSITMNAGYATGLISVVAAVTSITPLISVLIGRIFLREKMTMQQYLGAVVIVVGMLGISLLA
jgi:uncharacterized membrane protein